MPIILNAINESSKAVILESVNKAIQQKDWGGFEHLDLLDVSKMEVNTVDANDSISGSRYRSRTRNVALSAILGDSLIIFSMKDTGFNLPRGIHTNADGVPLAFEQYSKIYVMNVKRLN